MIISGVAAKRSRAPQRPVLSEQGMLGRSPQARHVLDGEHEHAQAVEQLQAGAVALGDVGHGLGDGRGDIADDEPDQHPVDDARGGLPAAAVLQDLEGALAQDARGSQALRPLDCPCPQWAAWRGASRPCAAAPA